MKLQANRICHRSVVALTMIAALCCAVSNAAEKSKPAPTLADVAYGEHPRQVLDFWKAESKEPTPLVLFIHGGGWSALDKSNAVKMLDVPRLLREGISVAAINYRFVSHAQKAGVSPPVKWPLEDAARALQIIRSNAEPWNLDKERVGACGGSAGACSSLWLALHDDMADPKSADPVARESTRLWCAAVAGAQTSLDPEQMRAWMPNITYGGHAFGFRTDGKDKAAEFQRFYDAREQILPFIKQYSPISHASADDPPLYLSYSQKERAVRGEAQADPTHSALFGLMLKEELAPLGVEVIVDYPAERHGRYRNLTDFFVAKLKQPQSASEK
ncbi:MAG: alpha/beta hydrolase [Planctomycetota bacterium]